MILSNVAALLSVSLKTGLAADLKIWEKFLKQTEVFVYAQ